MEKMSLLEGTREQLKLVMTTFLHASALLFLLLSIFCYLFYFIYLF